MTRAAAVPAVTYDEAPEERRKMWEVRAEQGEGKEQVVRHELHSEAREGRHEAREGWQKVLEVARPGPVPLFVHPGWSARFDWLVQGTTGRGAPDDFDLRLSGATPASTALGRWRRLRESLGMPRIVHAGQVHGARVLRHPTGEPAGLFLAEAADGHATRADGVLLTVTVADCIPISLVDPTRRALALLHGGWRGVAAGIIEEGVATLHELAGTSPEDLFLHLGPAICGACYEVGPEVYTALRCEAPPENRPIDLRAIAADRAAALGIAPERISISAHCTRCHGAPFFSHRAGSSGRQVGVLGIRPDGLGLQPSEPKFPEAAC